MPKSRNRTLNNEFSIDIIRSFEELEQFRDFWESVQCHPYTDIDYYLRFASAHEGFIKPHVTVLSQQNEPKSLLVGWIQEKQISWKLGYKTIIKTRARCIFVEYAGILGDASSSNCAALVKEIQNCLANGEADYAYFKFIRRDSPIFLLATQMPGFLTRDHFPFINPHWALTLPNSFEDFFSQLPSKTRTKLRRPGKLIKKKFGENYCVKCFKTKDEKEKALQDIESIASKTYQRGLAVGFQNSQQIYKEWEHTADRKWIRAYVLYLDGEPAAFNTGYVYGKTFIGLSTAFDPAYRHFSPGTFLFMQTIEDLCFDKKIEVMDFGYGPADYKKRICNQNWNDAEVYIFSPSFKGIQLNVIRSAIALFSRTLRNTLNHFKMINWVKKRWRQRLLPT